MASSIICEICEKRPATQISTIVVDGKKLVRYRCDDCAKHENTQVSLERPCEKCGKREGEIKLVRMRENRRIVSYICNVCALQR